MLICSVASCRHFNSGLSTDADVAQREGPIIVDPVPSVEEGLPIRRNASLFSDPLHQSADLISVAHGERLLSSVIVLKLQFYDAYLLTGLNAGRSII